MSPIEKCKETLRCSDETARIYAAEDIGYLNLPEGVPALLEQLQRENSIAVRDAIFQALIRMDGDEAIEGSVRLLGSEDPQIRNQAVDALRRKGSRSIPFLNLIMRDGDKHKKKLVLDVLSGMQAATAGEIYAAALSDEDLNVVITAVENLGRALDARFRGRIEELLLGNSHPMLTAACLETLAGIGDESSLAVIRRRFPDLAAVPDFLLASWLKAIAALGSVEDSHDVAGLLKVRGHHLRPAILSALTSIYPRGKAMDAPGDLLADLRAIVESGDPPLCRYQAVRVLGFYDAVDEVFAFLVLCLSSPERLIRLAAAESLQLSKRPGLQQLLASRESEESDEEVLQALGC